MVAATARTMGEVRPRIWAQPGAIFLPLSLLNSAGACFGSTRLTLTPVFNAVQRAHAGLIVRTEREPTQSCVNSELGGADES